MGGSLASTEYLVGKKSKGTNSILSPCGRKGREEKIVFVESLSHKIIYGCNINTEICGEIFPNHFGESKAIEKSYLKSETT
jgi:hypothetical protein